LALLCGGYIGQIDNVDKHLAGKIHPEIFGVEETDEHKDFIKGRFEVFFVF